MTDFSKILDKAKELEAKMKESQQKIKEIRVEGVSGSNSVKITLDGEGEMQTIKLSDEIMKESQQKIKEIRVEGVSGSNSVKITLDGEGEMQTINLSDEIMKEDKTIIEDLIIAAHNSAKSQLKSKTTEEISKATGGFGIPGFKWPL